VCKGTRLLTRRPCPSALALMQISTVRDARIDFARGLALLIIFTDHVYGNALSAFMPLSLCYTSMAEVFVFLSGYVGGQSYRRVFQRGGFLECLQKAIRRCIQVYFAHISTSAIVLAILIAWARSIDASDASVFPGYTAFQLDGWRFLIGVLALTRKVSDFDILPVYLSLLPALPAILFLESRWSILLPITSVAVYVMANGLRLYLFPRWPWTFNPFAWQLLFVAGVMLGIPAVKKMRLLPEGMVAVVVSFLILEFLFCGKLFAPELIPWTERENLELTRVLHFACVVILARSILRRFEFANANWARPILLCGRNSLATYCAGAVIANVLSLAGSHLGYSYDYSWSLLVNGIGWLGCIGSAWISEKIGRRRRDVGSQQ